MLNHPTLEKGNVGLTQVIASLELAGITCAIPIAHHLPFDLIAINGRGQLSRVQVKHCTLSKKGCINVRTTTVYSTKNKGHVVNHADMSLIDGYAVYCPNTNRCYYVSTDVLKDYGSYMSLRVDASDNSQYKGINLAPEFESPLILFPK